MSNEALMWLTIAVWLAFVGVIFYVVFIGKPPVAALPSGNTATVAQ